MNLRLSLSRIRSLEIVGRGTRRTADDIIYTGHNLHSIPHRIRIRQVISEIRKLSFPGFSLADVGCGGVRH